MLAALIFCCGMLITLASVGWLHWVGQRDEQARFTRHVDRLEAAITRRFVEPMYGLRGLRGMYAAMGHITRGEFRDFVASRNMQTEFPGVRGFGFIERVPRREVEAFTASARVDNAPQFRVKTSGHEPYLYVIKFIEPLAANQAALGLDVGAESVRREGVQRAVRTGQPTLTGRIVLVQDLKRGPGFLYLVPVYVKDSTPTTAAEREQALLGLLYTPISVAELMSGMVDAADKQLDFELFDGDDLSTANLLFDFDGHLGKITRTVTNADFAARARQTSRLLSVGGRTLTLRASTTPEFLAHTQLAAQVGIGTAGLCVSALLAAIVWLLGMGGARAQTAAERMTVDLRHANTVAETALRESQALLSSLHSYALIFITDHTGKIIETNAAFCAASGYAQEELLGQNPRIINSGEQSPFFWVDMWQTISSGQPWRGDICNRAKDGSLYWVDSIITPFLSADGTVEKYIAICNNITHIKATQEELRRRDERLELALEGGNDGLWDWVNVHAQDEWWSPQFFRLLGYQPDEIESSLVAFDEMLHPDDRARTFNALEVALGEQQIFEDLLDNRRGFDIEYRLRTKSGAYRWFHARAKVFFNEFGEATRLAGSIQDIHDRWVAQQQTQERSEQLDAIFSLSPDGFVSFDMNGRITYASPAAQRLSGLTLDELAGRTEPELLERLRANAANPSQLTSLAHAVSTGANHTGDAHAAVVAELLRPTRCTVELSVHRGDDSTSVSQVIHLRDVTYQTEVDQMKSEFLSTAAHELRTPMASIFGFTELLISREMPAEKQKQVLGKIYRQSQVMITILNELLDLARIEARRGKDFTLEPTDLRQLLDDVVRDFQPPQDRPLPELATPETAQWVNVDRNKLLQALRNLLSNAYKYSPGGGSVFARILPRTGPDGAPQTGVQIEDQGLGLTPEQLSRVCERFYRADKSGNIPGTGLGMSIVKEIIELLGGQMELTSEFGAGTTVTLWLPLTKPTHAPERIGNTADEAATATRTS